MELKQLGLVNKVPRLAVINAAGANTLCELYTNQGCRWNNGHYNRECVQAYLKHLDDINYKPHTVASAIEISRPVSLPKAFRALEVMNNGVVRQVTDEVILEHRAMAAKCGFGCEPASAASVAGLHQLLDEQVISPSETVVCILTGHELKDPDATVKYHTGINMKAAQVPAPEPVHGKYANKPIRVPDDVTAICKALGVDIEKTPLAGLAKA
jgi:threonine synthase